MVRKVLVSSCSVHYIQNSVNMVQVVEHLTEKGVSKEEALEVKVHLLVYSSAVCFVSVLQCGGQRGRGTCGHCCSTDGEA